MIRKLFFLSLFLSVSFLSFCQNENESNSDLGIEIIGDTIIVYESTMLKVALRDTIKHYGGIFPPLKIYKKDGGIYFHRGDEKIIAIVSEIWCLIDDENGLHFYERQLDFVSIYMLEGAVKNKLNDELTKWDIVYKENINNSVEFQDQKLHLIDENANREKSSEFTAILIRREFDNQPIYKNEQQGYYLHFPKLMHMGHRHLSEVFIKNVDSNILKHKLYTSIKVKGKLYWNYNRDSEWAPLYYFVLQKYFDIITF